MIIQITIVLCNVKRTRGRRVRRKPLSLAQSIRRRLFSKRSDAADSRGFRFVRFVLDSGGGVQLGRRLEGLSTPKLHLCG